MRRPRQVASLAKGLVSAGAVGLSAGCQPPDDPLQPLTLGRTWEYAVKTGMRKATMRLKATRHVPVGDAVGTELVGEMGVARLAWDKGRLMASQLAQARLVPPLPLLDPKGDARWQGWLQTGSERVAAKADVETERTQVELGTRSAKTVRSRVLLRSGGRKIELLTWFEPGVGVVLQEQRTDDRLDVSLQFIGGG